MICPSQSDDISIREWYRGVWPDDHNGVFACIIDGINVFVGLYCGWHECVCVFACIMEGIDCVCVCLYY